MSEISAAQPVEIPDAELPGAIRSLSDALCGVDEHGEPMPVDVEQLYAVRGELNYMHAYSSSFDPNCTFRYRGGGKRDAEGNFERNADGDIKLYGIPQRDARAIVAAVDALDAEGGTENAAREAARASLALDRNPATNRTPNLQQAEAIVRKIEAAEQERRIANALGAAINHAYLLAGDTVAEDAANVLRDRLRFLSPRRGRLAYELTRVTGHNYTQNPEVMRGLMAGILMAMTAVDTYDDGK